MDDAERQAIVQGLAALAVTFAEMGSSDVEALSQLHGQFALMGNADISIVEDAAGEVAHLPPPLDDRPEETDARPPRHSGVVLPPADSELAASLQGRVWLEQLARRLRGGRATA